MSKLNIYERLSAVREEVAYLQKSKQVETYKAVTHDQVTANVRPSFIKHGILVVPKLISSRVVDTTMVTGKGTPYVRYEGRFAIWFVNVEDPQDRECVELDAHALDHGDKAPGKAISYATKYAMLKILNIETGEEEESRMEVRSVEDKASAVLNEWAVKINGTTTLPELEAVWKSMPQVLRKNLDEKKNAAKDRILAAAKGNGDAAGAAQ